MDTNNNNNAINLEHTLVWATCHKYQSAHTLQQKQIHEFYVEAVTLQFLSVLVIYKDSLHWYITPISTTTT